MGPFGSLRPHRPLEHDSEITEFFEFFFDLHFIPTPFFITFDVGKISEDDFIYYIFSFCPELIVTMEKN